MKNLSMQGFGSRRKVLLFHPAVLLSSALALRALTAPALCAGASGLHERDRTRPEAGHQSKVSVGAQAAVRPTQEPDRQAQAQLKFAEPMQTKVTLQG